MRPLSTILFYLFGVMCALSVCQAQNARAKNYKPKENKPSGVYGTLVEVGLPHFHWSFGKALGLEGMEVAVLRASDRVEVKRVTAGWSGKFKITLPAGKYIVEPVIPDPDPNSFSAIGKHEAKVTVWPGFYSAAAPYFDAGF